MSYKKEWRTFYRLESGHWIETEFADLQPWDFIFIIEEDGEMILGLFLVISRPYKRSDGTPTIEVI